VDTSKVRSWDFGVVVPFCMTLFSRPEYGTLLTLAGWKLAKRKVVNEKEMREICYCGLLL